MNLPTPVSVILRPKVVRDSIKIRYFFFKFTCFDVFILLQTGLRTGLKAVELRFKRLDWGAWIRYFRLIDTYREMSN